MDNFDATNKCTLLGINTVDKFAPYFIIKDIYNYHEIMIYKYVYSPAPSI